MTFEIPRESYPAQVRTVTIGAGEKSLSIGGATCLPFHSFDQDPGHPPRIAMEVFDEEPAKYPPPLRDYFFDVLERPKEMALRCIDMGAELISLRLLGLHPEKGKSSIEASVELVKELLAEIDVPLIVTGVNHFDRSNQALKKIAEETAGKNLLLNWMETENYKTIAASAMAYGHCAVALSPVDINMAKQLNILARDLGLDAEKIVMDPMTSPLGYGLDYGYTIAERIRLAALRGDELLANPMIFNIGWECARVKETHESEDQYPEWGSREERSALWEIVSASSLLMAGADLLILYHPKAVEVMKSKRDQLSAKGGE